MAASIWLAVTVPLFAQSNSSISAQIPPSEQLGRERFPGIGQAPPPKESPQRRERCPQNMFDPILRSFAASQKTVEMRYRTRLISFTQDAERLTAIIENADTGARELMRLGDEVEVLGPPSVRAHMHTLLAAMTKRHRVAKIRA